MPESRDDPPRDHGPYRITGKLGRGGMAQVLKAVHSETGQTVALKVFTSADFEGGELFKRAKREVAALQMCAHPNILKVHDFRLEPDRGGWVAMEYIKGRNLQELSTERGRFPPHAVLAIGLDVAGALAYCHSRGLFHRDIKPANIMVESHTCRAVLLDFGIVKATNMTQISGLQSEIIGTLTYMAPEQFLGRTVDARTDIYQLGLVLFRLATASDPPAVMDLVECSTGPRSGLPPLRTIVPETPEPLEACVTNCTHLDENQRYSDAQELIADLERANRGEAVAVRRPRPTKRLTPVAGRTTGRLQAVAPQAQPPAPPAPPPAADGGQKGDEAPVRPGSGVRSSGAHAPPARTSGAHTPPPARTSGAHAPPPSARTSGANVVPPGARTSGAVPAQSGPRASGSFTAQTRAIPVVRPTGRTTAIMAVQPRRKWLIAGGAAAALGLVALLIWLLVR